MDLDLPTAAPKPAEPHRATFTATIGDRASMSAEVTITTPGLLAIGALVSSILVSSAVIVWAARNQAGRGSA